MYPNPNYEAKPKTSLNGVTLAELHEYGYCHYEDELHLESGAKITVSVYELDNKTYLIKYVDDECVMLRDITATRRQPNDRATI